MRTRVCVHVFSRSPTSQESPEYPIGQSHFSIWCAFSLSLVGLPSSATVRLISEILGERWIIKLWYLSFNMSKSLYICIIYVSHGMFRENYDYDLQHSRLYMFLLWKWSLVETIFITPLDTNKTWCYFSPIQIILFSAIKLHIYSWTMLCVRACHCVWVCVLLAVSHQVSMWRLNKDVVHIEQNVHEVLSSHGPAICILPLMLYTHAHSFICIIPCADQQYSSKVSTVNIMLRYYFCSYFWTHW